MNFRKMEVDDINKVIDLYIRYYNEVENSTWTEKKAFRRIHQVITMDDSFSLLMLDASDRPLGFAMGYFKQYDDILGYTLEEIIIKYSDQNKGYGSLLLREIEVLAKNKGASCIELQAVNDKMHLHFYDKAFYLDSDSFVNKVKWLD